MKERGQGRPEGAPKEDRTPQKEQGSRQKESAERQPLPNVWDVLGHRVQVYTPDRNRTFGERVDQKKAVNRWMDGLKKKGTDRDRLILDLYTSVTVQPGPGERIERELLLEEFPQFRSKVEPMSDDEIRKEIRKEEEEKQRKIEESRNTNRPLTLDQPKPIWQPPDPSTGTFC
jgi:nitric oxide reductase activation protein